MRRIYRMPIMGSVKNGRPLKGVDNSPLQVIPLDKLPGYENLSPKGYGYTCLEYNVDEDWCDIELEANDALHEWLLGLMPNLRDIAKEKDWKLDKTELEKVRKARMEKQ